MVFILSILKNLGITSLPWAIILIPIYITVFIWVIGWISVFIMRKRMDND